MNFASTKVSALARFPYGILTRAALQSATRNLLKNVSARSWRPPRSHLPYTNFNFGRKKVLLMKPSKNAFVYTVRNPGANKRGSLRRANLTYHILIYFFYMRCGRRQHRVPARRGSGSRTAVHSREG